MEDYLQEDMFGSEETPYDANSPLSSILRSRAKEFYKKPYSVQEKRDALMGAYQKLIEAKKNSAQLNPGIESWVSGATQLANSGDPSLEGFGKGQAAAAMMRQKQLEAREKASLDSEMLALEQQARMLGFDESDRENELKYLSAASANDMAMNKARLYEMMLLQKAKGDSGGLDTTSPDSPYRGLDKVGQRQLYMKYQKDLDKANDAAEEVEPSITDAKRFLELNEKINREGDESIFSLGTGGFSGNIPLRGKFNEDFSEMDAIAAKIVPQMRVPGSGASSDKDVTLFEKATFGVGKPKETNENIANAYLIQRQNMLDKADFLQAYLSQKGHLSGADKAWRKYLNDNPIFDQEEKDNYGLNKKRKKWDEYFLGDQSSLEDAASQDKTISEKSTSSEVPAGIDPKIWKHMTPEQKRLWQ